MDKNNKISAGVEKDTASKVSAPAVEKSKKIEVDESILQQLMDSNRKMEAQIEALSSNAVATNANNGMAVRRKVKEDAIRLRKWNDKYVIGMVNVGNEKRPRYVYDVIDKDTKKAVQFCNLILEDGEIVEGVIDIDFRRDAETVPGCTVISKVEHEDVKEYGFIPKKEMAENGYGMFETMVLVPVEVVSKTFTFTVKVPDRDEPMVIESEWANM